MKSALDLLHASPLLETLAPEHLAHLADHSRMLSVAEGEVLFRQGDPATACYMLVVGKVRLSFQPPPGEAHGATDAAEPELPLREVDAPGHLLGWSGMVAPYRCRTTATALAPTQLLVFDKAMLDDYVAARPEFGVAFLERLIWILGNRLRETRIRLVSQRYETETAAIRALLDQSAEVLPVDSPLHKIPLYLENRLTIADAFHSLELVRAHGDQHERDIAALSLEILQHVWTQLKLYQDLQRVYEAVAGAPADMPAQEVRNLCCREFIRLFERVDHAIAGEANLPRTPGHIFIMNHLFNHPDNTLPNRFQLTLDTHFVSSMVLMKGYGEAPVRVIRKSLRDEYGHQKYYDRLGYIYVYSGHVDESVEDPHIPREERRRSFFDSARDCLAAGQNLVICPEGTSVATEDSPVAFKPGAFRLAAQVEPEPLIVPVAVANFDKDITRTRVAAVVHEPFRLSETVGFPLEDKALFAFLEGYRETFAGYVRDAVALARDTASSTAAD